MNSTEFLGFKNPRSPYAAISGGQIAEGLEFVVRRFDPHVPALGYEACEFGVFETQAGYDGTRWTAVARLAHDGIARALEAEPVEIALHTIGVVPHGGSWERYVLTVPADAESF